MPDAKKMVSFINYWLRPLSEDYAYAVCLLFVNTFCREYFALDHSILIICKISLNVSTCVQMRVLFRTFVASRESNTHTRTQSLKIFTIWCVDMSLVAVRVADKGGTIKAQSHFSIYCGNFAKKRFSLAPLWLSFRALLL